MFGCGSNPVELGGDGGNTGNPDGGNGGGGDGGNTGNPDGGNTGGCTAGGTQCNNCIDDDNDGLVDGYDPHCISAADDDEASFATGIPGDNMDAINQDCFFDGDSGAGNDGCNIHICCLLGAATQADCPAEFKPDQYDPGQCTPSQQCIDNCGAITPPGCDCFGCCTICNDTGCYDVITHPEAAPNCDVDVLDDPALCPACTPNPDCGTPCDNTQCVLCPGQDPSDLPAGCNGDNACPDGLTECVTTDDCAVDYFCSNGCCVSQIIVN